MADAERVMPARGDDLQVRTKRFALRAIRLVESLPRGRTADTVGRQLLRCGTSVGANYRAACRARFPAEFMARMGIVEEEADESAYWIELLVEAGLVDATLVAELAKEANELVAMTIASIKTTRARSRK